MSQPENHAEDLRHSRREAMITLVVWAVATLYSVGYCYTFGHGRSAESLTFIWGFPDWVFVGILVPWTACTVFSIWFSGYYMTDYEWADSELADEDTQGERTGE